MAISSHKALISVFPRNPYNLQLQKKKKKKEELILFTFSGPKLIFKNYKKEVEILKGNLRIRKGLVKEL